MKKGGAWIALDGNGTRRHVLGYDLIRNSNLTERSVITTTNFIPAGKRFFLYQTAKYDLTGPGGRGKGGLDYVFAKARFKPVRAVEVMLNYHHGLSIDYASSLAIVRVVGDGGAIIEQRPRTKRYGFSSVWHLTRVVSVILNAEELKDDTSTDDRLVIGVTYRF